jgi:D-alanine-D-alanine ligase-like ATP-grasp enzyme
MKSYIDQLARTNSALNASLVPSMTAYASSLPNKPSNSSIGLPTGFLGANNATDIITFINTHGYPIVIKPRRGHSSIGASIIHNEHQLAIYLNDHPSTDDNDWSVDVETFVTGQMYHVDGFMYQGEVKFLWPSRYVNTCIGFKDNKFLGSGND